MLLWAYWNQCSNEQMQLKCSSCSVLDSPHYVGIFLNLGSLKLDIVLEMQSQKGQIEGNNKSLDLLAMLLLSQLNIWLVFFASGVCWWLVELVEQNLRSFSLGMLSSHFNTKPVLLHMVDAFQIQDFVFAFELASPFFQPVKILQPSGITANSSTLELSAYLLRLFISPDKGGKKKLNNISPSIDLFRKMPSYSLNLLQVGLHMTDYHPYSQAVRAVFHLLYNPIIHVSPIFLQEK